MKNEITQYKHCRNMRQLVEINGKTTSVLQSKDRLLARKLLTCYEYYIWDGIMISIPYALKDKYPLYKDPLLYSEYFSLVTDGIKAGIPINKYDEAIAGLIKKKYLRLVDDIYECYERPYDKI